MIETFFRAETLFDDETVTVSADPEGDAEVRVVCTSTENWAGYTFHLSPEDAYNLGLYLIGRFGNSKKEKPDGT